MNELITTEQADVILRCIAIAAPALGLLIGAMAGWTHKRALGGMAAGFVIGFTGTAVFGLWRMYLAFGARYGFTSVGSLIVQAVIFVGIGCAALVAFRRIRRFGS